VILNVYLSQITMSESTIHADTLNSTTVPEKSERIITTSNDKCLVFSDFKLNQTKRITGDDRILQSCMYVQLEHPDGPLPKRIAIL
jgi:hypothetical protein